MPVRTARARGRPHRRLPSAAPTAPQAGPPRHSPDRPRPTLASADPPAGVPLTTPAQDATLLERAMFEVKRVIVGQDRMIERMFVALLARGHCLLEGVPGVAKTLAVETIARVVGGSFARIQFTPDLVPADIVGTRIYRQSSEVFDIELGPVFVNFLLADEINRAPAKVQSALLEVMAEQHVSIGGRPTPVPRSVPGHGHPEPDRAGGCLPAARGAARPVPAQDRGRLPDRLPKSARSSTGWGSRRRWRTRCSAAGDLLGLQRKADEVFVHNALVDYAVRLVLATRTPAEFGMDDVARLIQYGASPRASLGIVRATRALALLRGRDYALPQDLQDIAPDILRHRLVLTYDALADDITADRIVDRVLATVPLPTVTVPPERRPAPPTSANRC